MKEFYGENNIRRWYDKDPVLSKAMKTLETSDDQFQLQMAINIIKIIIEHNIENEAYTSVEDIMAAVGSGQEERGNSRWYDLDNTLRTAIQMLEMCPVETQSVIVKKMADLITEKFNEAE